MKPSPARLFRSFGISLVAGVILLMPVTSLGKVFHWPEVCEVGTLTIQNQSNDELRFFLQTFNPRLMNEDAITVDAYQTSHFEVSGYSLENLQKRLSLLSLNSDHTRFRVSMKCNAEIYEASAQQSGEWVFKKQAHFKTHKVLIKNLSPSLNTIEIITFNESTSKSRTIDIQGFEQKSILLKDIDGWPYFKIRSDSKLSVFYLDHHSHVAPIQVSAVPFKNVDSSGVYFEVQNRTKTEDSFVIHIKDPDMIARARTILANPQSEKIVVGEVKLGSGRHNRNLHSADKAPWSWHVSRVTNFSDFASTACNGIPQIVEDRVLSWITDPGRICFWTYRLKREVPATEL